MSVPADESRGMCRMSRRSGKGQKNAFAVIGRCFAMISEGKSSMAFINFVGGDICGRRIT